MEQWQKDIIVSNKIYLMDNTAYSVKFLDTFVTNEVISKEEKEKMECKRDRGGSTEWASEFYDLIIKKDKGYNILLETCLDKNFAQQAVAKFLTQKAIEAGMRHTLPKIALGSSSSTSSVKGQDQLDSSYDDDSSLPEELNDFVLYGKPLTVKVEEPTEERKPPVNPNKTYKLSPNGKGYAFIVNILNCNGCVPRKGAENDTKNMVKLMKGFKYEIFPEDPYLLYTESKWTKETVLSELKKFKEQCKRDEVDSIVVFVGSHGFENHILTADGQPMHDSEFINPLQDIDSVLLKPVAKIFITQACQGEKPDWMTLPVLPPPAPINHTIHIKAQVPKREAGRDEKCGTYFVLVLVYVLMKFARDTKLHKMLKKMQRYMVLLSKDLKLEDYQISPYTDTGLAEDFYFFN
ncbi:unnamed protein product [Orchesella dallaii]|uniref:Uncharacterized protein n=1 Tax=Orchesella dallaii TaxID=48710 RepID=A0ABP1RJ36_9HEXA